jgi:hypothetical protein
MANSMSHRFRTIINNYLCSPNSNIGYVTKPENIYAEVTRKEEGG